MELILTSHWLKKVRPTPKLSTHRFLMLNLKDDWLKQDIQDLLKQTEQISFEVKPWQLAVVCLEPHLSGGLVECSSSVSCKKCCEKAFVEDEVNETL